MPQMPPFMMPPGGRMPMAFPMMQQPYPGYMPGAPFAMPGQMGPMGPMGAMPPGMPVGMPAGMPGGMPLSPMMPQMGAPFMQPPMMPQQPVQAQNLPTDKEELGERLYPKIEQLIDPA